MYTAYNYCSVEKQGEFWVTLAGFFPIAHCNDFVSAMIWATMGGKD